MRFNLSEWALRNRSLVLYTMIVVAIAGVFSYLQLGRSEDPPFTFKAMVIRTLWPGATADEVAQQVTERLEKKLMETGDYEFIRSYSRPGESQVIFIARDSMRSKEIPELWYQVRKKVGDIRATLPEGVVETHVSLFDGSNCGIRVEGRPVFSVQHHPEASPGPQDSFYLFQRFRAAMG